MVGHLISFAIWYLAKFHVVVCHFSLRPGKNFPRAPRCLKDLLLLLSPFFSFLFSFIPSFELQLFYTPLFNDSHSFNFPQQCSPSRFSRVFCWPEWPRVRGEILHLILLRVLNDADAKMQAILIAAPLLRVQAALLIPQIRPQPAQSLRPAPL